VIEGVKFQDGVRVESDHALSQDAA
jgi:hypothetical protein